MKFSQYYKQLKEELLEESEKVLEFSTTHTVSKYCKFPISEDGKREYLSFKMNDEIVVEWERVQGEITPKSLKFLGESYESFWNSERFKKWVLRTSKQTI